LQAKQTVFSPAEDTPSQGQFGALAASLDKARNHNKTMFDYADAYVEKLTAALERYVANEEANVARMRGVDEG